MNKLAILIIVASCLLPGCYKKNEETQNFYQWEISGPFAEGMNSEIPGFRSNIMAMINNTLTAIQSHTRYFCRIHSKFTQC